MEDVGWIWLPQTVKPSFVFFLAWLWCRWSIYSENEPLKMVIFQFTILKCDCGSLCYFLFKSIPNDYKHDYTSWQAFLAPISQHGLAGQLDHEMFM